VSCVANADKASMKNDVVFQYLSTQILPCDPLTDVGMSKRIPDNFVKKKDEHELNYFCSLIHHALNISLQLCFSCSVLC
jgi:hypothetical protein